MAIGDDFEVQADGDIRHVSGTAHYTVIELHRWLGQLMDDAQASGNDLLDITDATASERATDNLITLNSPFNVDDDAVQYLYDGSIVQKNGDEIYDGLVVIAAQGMYLQIIQNGALVAPNYWTTAWNADAAAGISHRFMLKVRTAGADIDGRRLIGTTRELGFTFSEFRIATGTARGNNVLALNYSVDLNNATVEATIATWSDITNVTEGYNLMDVDDDLVDEAYYSEWNKGSRTINQFYERCKWLTRRGTTETLYGLDGDLFRGITHDITITTPRSGTWGTPEHEVVTWTGGTGRLFAVDNKTGSATTKMWIQLLTGVAPTNTQLITGQTSAATGTCSGTPTERPLSLPFCGASTGSSIIGAYGFGIEEADLTSLDKVFDLTNQQRLPPNQVSFSVGGLATASGGDRILVAPLGYYIQYDGETGGPFVKGETLTFGTPGGTAYLSELLDLGTFGFMKVRMLTGVPPLDNSTIAGGTSLANAAANGDAVVSEDPRQLKLATTLSGASETAVVCIAAIPTDTPKPTGTIRIQLDSGIYRRVPYTSYSGSTFTIDPTDFSGANQATGGAVEAGNSIFVSYIDKNAGATSESFTVVYAANRDLFVRVRFGGTPPIKTFQSSGALTGAGGSATAIRTADA